MMNEDGTPTNVTEIGEFAIPIDNYFVAEWGEEKDGKAEPSQVHIVIPLDLDGEKGAIAIRFKSKESVSQLIGMLHKHSNLVWPKR